MTIPHVPRDQCDGRANPADRASGRRPVRCSPAAASGRPHRSGPLRTVGTAQIDPEQVAARQFGATEVGAQATLPRSVRPRDLHHAGRRPPGRSPGYGRRCDRSSSGVTRPTSARAISLARTSSVTTASYSVSTSTRPAPSPVSASLSSLTRVERRRPGCRVARPRHEADRLVEVPQQFVQPSDDRERANIAVRVSSSSRQERPANVCRDTFCPAPKQSKTVQPSNPRSRRCGWMRHPSAPSRFVQGSPASLSNGKSADFVKARATQHSPKQSAQSAPRSSRRPSSIRVRPVTGHPNTATVTRTPRRSCPTDVAGRSIATSASGRSSKPIVRPIVCVRTQPPGHDVVEHGGVLPDRDAVAAEQFELLARSPGPSGSPVRPRRRGAARPARAGPRGRSDATAATRGGTAAEGVDGDVRPATRAADRTVVDGVRVPARRRRAERRGALECGRARRPRRRRARRRRRRR